MQFACHYPVPLEPSSLLEPSPLTRFVETTSFLDDAATHIGNHIGNQQARALTCNELRDPTISAIIARKLANVHSLNVPINKEPTWLFSTMYEWLEKVRTLNVDELREKDRAIQSSKKATGKKQQQPIVKNPFNYEAAKFIIEFDYEREIEWLKEFLKQCDSPVVFAHNDLQEGNILIPDYLSSANWSNKPADFAENNNRLNVKNKNKPKHLSTAHLRKNDLLGYKFNPHRHQRRSSSPDDLYDSGLVNDQLNSDEDDGLVNDFGSEEECSASQDDELHQRTKQHHLKQLEEKMVLIDFEYCAYNYRGFDLANHFCEWMYDYSYEKFPCYKFNPNNYANESQLRHFINEYVRHFYQGENYIGAEEEKAMVDKILNEIRYFTLASHLLWTLWSINNAIKAQISFGYWVSLANHSKPNTPLPCTLVHIIPFIAHTILIYHHLTPSTNLANPRTTPTDTF